MRLARAKVNLWLNVVGRRADGYHLLDSLVAFTDLADRLEVGPSDGLTLSLERGCDLRSRCLLFPEDALVFQLLETPGKPEDFKLSSKEAIALYNEAVDAGKKAGLPWETAPIELTPSPQLVALVKKSQELAAASEGTED